LDAPVLLVSGLSFEAEPVAAGLRRQRLPARVVVAGPGPLRAERLTAFLAERPAAVVGFGLCGALDPSLGAGAVVVPRTVGMAGAEDLPTTLPVPGRAAQGRLLTVVLPVANPSEKARLASEAVAVDQESYVWLRAARAAGIPMAILRMVLDGAGEPLPMWSKPESWISALTLPGRALALRRRLTDAVLALLPDLLRITSS
jgi:adenosylhomocysteine nucleosidase